MDSKPAEVRMSTYLLLLVRRGLNAGVEGLSTSVKTGRDFVDNGVDNSLQTRITGLEAQIEGINQQMREVLGECRA